MRIAVPHNTDKSTARQKIEERLHQVLATYGHYLTDHEHRWEGDRLFFSGKAKGMKADGTVDITDNGSAIYSCSITTGNTTCTNTSAGVAVTAGHRLQVKITNVGGAPNKAFNSFSHVAHHG